LSYDDDCYEDEGPGRHDERCPTCGRFVSHDEGYGDLPPGGLQSLDYLEGYCDAACADRKSPKAHYEDDSDYEEHYAKRTGKAYR
jgi:hypothetical protein